ncbi:MAG: hypothetical protein V3R45_02630, partial [Candidatus Aminicenantaceae bacterium]
TLKVPMVLVNGWECDDVIGVITCNLPDGIRHGVVVSDDKDFFQLVRGIKVVVWRAIKEELITQE